MTQFMLAPLAGITDWPFRLLCFEKGCDAATTEMVSALGWRYSKKLRATQDLLRRAEGETKLAVQLFGKDPSALYEAAYDLSRSGNYETLDINMGCPVRKVACSGEGSGLMRTPELAFEMMKAAVEASVIPVTVKMRLGWDSEHLNAAELVHLAEKAGVSAVTVHGRTRQQMYSGSADWDAIRTIKAVASIPVYGNGDVFTAEDAVRRLNETGVDGIVIARGALGNPWIFRDIQALLAGKKPEPPTPEERMAAIRKQYEMMLSWKPERVAVREMRKHISWYVHGIRGAAAVRSRINQIDDPAEALAETEKALLHADIE